MGILRNPNCSARPSPKSSPKYPLRSASKVFPFHPLSRLRSISDRFVVCLPISVFPTVLLCRHWNVPDRMLYCLRRQHFLHFKMLPLSLSHPPHSNWRREDLGRLWDWRTLVALCHDWQHRQNALVYARCSVNLLFHLFHRSNGFTNNLLTWTGFKSLEDCFYFFLFPQHFRGSQVM